MANANIKAVITAEDKASATLAHFSDGVSNIGSHIVNVAKIAAAAMSAAGVAAGTFALKSAADFEQTRIGLENMLGSADDARVLLKKISDFAAKTPFEFPELAQSTRQLVAFGFSADDAYETMKQLGNVSAAVGAPINDLAYLMGTLRTQGRAFTIDLRQFAQRGIPIYEQLEKVLHVNGEQLTKMVEDGKIGFPQVQKAFEDLAGTGGRWGNAMERQSKSVNGLFSTLKDTVGITARELVGITQEGDIKEGSVFARLRDAVSGLNEHLPEMIDHLKVIVRDIIPQLKQWGSNIANVATQVRDYLQPKVIALANAVRNELFPVLERLWRQVIEPMAPVIGTVLVIAIGAAIGAMRIWIAVISQILNTFISLYTFVTKTLPDALQNAVGLIVQGFAWLKDNGIELIGEVIGFIATLPIKLPIFFVEAIAGIIKVIAGVSWSKVFSGIWQGMQDVWDKITHIVNIAWQHIHDIEWGKLFTGIGKSFANGLIDLIEGALKGALKGLPGNIENKINLPRFKAMGGPVAGNSPYIVGERGPEMFVPSQSGTIIPNHALGGGTVNVSVNVGMYAGTQMEKRRMAEELFKALQDVAQTKNMSVAQMMGS